MSQRIFKTDRLKVNAGWDKQLQRYFLVVERIGGKDEDPDHGYEFNNLAMNDPDSLTLEHIGNVLSILKWTPPPTCYTDLISDRHNNSVDRHEYPA